MQRTRHFLKFDAEVAQLQRQEETSSRSRYKCKLDQYSSTGIHGLIYAGLQIPIVASDFISSTHVHTHAHSWVFYCNWKIYYVANSEPFWVSLPFSHEIINITFSMNDYDVYSSVGIETSYGLDGPGSMPGSARLFSSPQRRDRLWSPPSISPNGYWRLLPWR
jgi:hypothetical protein